MNPTLLSDVNVSLSNLTKLHESKQSQQIDARKCVFYSLMNMILHLLSTIASTYKYIPRALNVLYLYHVEAEENQVDA